MTSWAGSLTRCPFFFFNDPAPTEIYTLPLHAALPIYRRGGWEVDFVTDSRGRPSIVIYQPRLNVSSVEILFGDERTLSTNLSKRITFDRPLNKVLFGRVLYEDLTVLPGVVT